MTQFFLALLAMLSGVFASNDALGQVPFNPQWQLLSAVPNAQNILVAGTTLIAYNVDTIYRSTDDGLSWEVSLLDAGRILTLSYSVDSDGLIFIARNLRLNQFDFDLLRSTDYGQSWERTGSGWQGRYPIIWSLNHETFMCDAGRQGQNGIVWKTSDHGDSWVKIWDGIRLFNSVEFDHGTCSPTTGHMLLCNDKYTPYPFYLSTDSGKTWIGITASGPWPVVPQYNSHGVLLGPGGNGVSVSTDDGRTWSVSKQYDSSRSGTGRFVLDNRDNRWLMEDFRTYYNFSAAGATTWDSVSTPLVGQGAFWGGPCAVSSRGTVFVINSGNLAAFGDDSGALFRSTQFHLFNTCAPSAEPSFAIQVTPNPAYSEIRIDGLPASAHSISIYDMIGHQVIRQDANSQLGNLRVILEGLPDGWYAVGVTGGSTTAVFLKSESSLR